MNIWDVTICSLVKVFDP